MLLEELKKIMPACVNCHNHCPIDNTNCERGRDMVSKITSGEATPEEYIRKAVEKMKEHRAGEDERPHEHGRFPEFGHFRPHGSCENRHGPHAPEGSECGHKGRKGPGPDGFGRPPFGFRMMPGMPGGHPHMPRPMPQDDSLGSLLFFAAHASRPRPPKGAGRGDPGMGQRRVLRLLAETGSISQQSLQEILAIRPGSLSELLGKLENKGLITRTQDEADRRKNYLSLTDEGRTVLDNLNEEADPFSCLAEEEKETLKVLLKKIIEANR